MRTITSLTIAVLLVTPALAADGALEGTLLDPAGPIASAERQLMLWAAGIMLIVVVPVFVLAGLFAWRYREGGKHTYAPDWDFSRLIEIGIWFVPLSIIAVLGALTWTSTHKLDPYRALAGSGPVMHVQAIALDWKWLFVYPDARVASVGDLVVPIGRDVSVSLTSDTVMNSFSVPALAGQIYAMAGMQTQLHLRADRPGSYPGRNTQFSGAGFPTDAFVVRAVSDADFRAFLDRAAREGESLTLSAYDRLADPASPNEPRLYRDASPTLFGSVMTAYERGTVAPRVLPGGNQ